MDRWLFLLSLLRAQSKGEAGDRGMFRNESQQDKLMLQKELLHLHEKKVFLCIYTLILYSFENQSCDLTELEIEQMCHDHIVRSKSEKTLITSLERVEMVQ